jgi:YHS domain-containing protein
MKVKKLLFVAVLTAIFLVANLSYSQASDEIKSCQKNCKTECCKNCTKDCCKSECCKNGKEECCKNCSLQCKNKSGNSQGVVSDSAKVCPVTGEKIDGSEGEPLKLTYLGKEYQFCCTGCLKKFKAEPMNYIKEEIKCPVMGEPADKNISSIYNGVKYYFCCSSCDKKFEKEPEKYLNKNK